MDGLGWKAVTRGAPPGALAKAAARRAGRALRNVLSGRPPTVDERALLTAFAIDFPRALAGRVFCARPNVVADRSGVEAALAKLPEARARALERARRAADRRFDVFGTEVVFPPDQPIDWHRDPLSGHSYPKQPVGQLVFERRGLDPKYPWVLGRLEQALALGQGYWATKDPEEARRFAAAFVAQVSDFLIDNPVGVGVHWTMPMEVALRAANLAIALLMFDDAEPVRAPSFLMLCLRSLAEHAAYVEAHLEDQGAVPNNHLVGDWVGLLVVSALFPELPGAPRWSASAVRGLREAMATQVHEDGYSFEGSTGYHRLSAELFTLAWLAARAAGFDLGGAYEERLKRMYRVAAAYCSEHGRAPQIGDNDSGRALPFCDRQSLDHGYLRPLGAALFGDAECKREGDAYPDEALWTLGEAGRWAFCGLAATPPPRAFHSREGGLVVLRAGEATLTVSAGPKGQRGVGGHSHHDQLSFELHVGGVPLIVDPGCGQYTRDPAQRNFLRSTAAHNVVQVDGQEMGPLDPSRLFALPGGEVAEVTVLQPGEGTARLEAVHRPVAGVQVHRSFLIDARSAALKVVDAVRGEGLHSLTSRLHLPDLEARLRPPTEEELARAGRVPLGPTTFAPVAVELGPVEAPRAVVLVEEGLQPRLVTASYSPGYGEIAPAQVIVFELERALPTRCGWLVLFGLGREGEAGK